MQSNIKLGNLEYATKRENGYSKYFLPILLLRDIHEGDLYSLEDADKEQSHHH